ncbi:diaminopimelate epimerase [Bacteroidota bacterium]
MKLKVTYMSGAGNTFTVVDNREYNLSPDFYSLMAPYLCGQNNTGLNTEGLLILNMPGNNTAFEVDFFNPDGSNGMMCGNGGRCALMFAGHQEFLNEEQKKNNVFFKMGASIYHGRFRGDNIRLYFPAPIEIKKNVKILVNNKNITGVYVNVNSDHFVINHTEAVPIQDESFDDFCIDTFASAIRFHEDFKPNGVNVNIYSVESRNKILLRTYERGVEAETGACGTGALSTMLASLSNDEIDLPVIIIPPSKSPLIVDIDGEFPDKIEYLVLEGNAEIKKQTEIEISDKYIPKLVFGNKIV